MHIGARNGDHTVRSYRFERITLRCASSRTPAAAAGSSACSTASERGVTGTDHRRHASIAAVGILLGVGACASQASDVNTSQPLRVHDTAELIAALQPANAGRRIELAAGEYRVDRPLVVPDGATLAGAGTMRLDDEDLPQGFAAGTESTLRVVGGFAGSVLTLGNGSALHGLRVMDLPNTVSEPQRRRGNVVLVASRRPADSVVASVVDCELINPNLAGFTDDGPYGHGVAALTLNPSLGAPPAAHEGAAITVRVERSRVRTQTGGAIFAMNFAARGHVALRLDGNRFEGYMVAAGGVSRPDAVTGATTTIDSRRNLFTVNAWPRAGWFLIGGSTSPHYVEAGIPGASGVSLRFDSKGDRIEGFDAGVWAAAARRIGPASSPLSDNRLELRLEGTRISSVGEAAADLLLRGAVSEAVPFVEPGEFAAGDRNVLHASLNDVAGSGVTRNRYAHVEGPVQPANAGAGNRLVVEGTPEQFRRSNRAIEPEPAAVLFTGAR